MPDLVVIGGGPAGLSAATNGAAEGLSTTLLESSPECGGQAGTSSRIENYLGFPEGLSGEELTDRATAQARRLGADLVTGAGVAEVSRDWEAGHWVLTCESGAVYEARAVLVAAGVDYRRLDLPGADTAPLLYGATPADHEQHSGESVAVIGGGNSAGQAILSLVRAGALVTSLARRPLSASMSAYLVARVERDPRVTVLTDSPVRFDGAAVTLSSGAVRTFAAFFVYVGARPRADYLRGVCDLDGAGFVRSAAGADYRTGVPGLYVAGDIRAGSRKRVAAAAGEGAVAAAQIWSYLNDSK